MQYNTLTNWRIKIIWSYMTFLTDAEKAFDKIQHPFMIKNPQQSGHRGNASQHHIGHIWQIQSQHHPQR